MTTDMQDRIDSYLKGQMTKEEESKFLEDCKKDKELKEQAILTARMIKVMKKSYQDENKDKSSNE